MMSVPAANVAQVTELLQRANAAGTPQELEELLSEIYAGGRLRPFLSHVISDDELCAEIAGRSYRHSNGFDKVVVCALGRESAKLRFHVWVDPTSVESETSVHDHPWDFASLVVSGALDNVFYELSQDGDPYYALEIGTNESEGVRPADPVLLSVSRRNRLEAPCLYSQHRALLHAAVPARLDTVTLVLQGSHQRSKTLVYRRDGRKATPYDVRFFRREEVRDLLTQLLRRLS